MAVGRTVVNVATTEHTLKGQYRLLAGTREFGGYGIVENFWGKLPAQWPEHADKPYAFKAYALEYCSRGFDSLLWCDACILPIRSMEPVWAKIERDGYLLMRNGFSNYEWTADSAYPDLFPDGTVKQSFGLSDEDNRSIHGWNGSAVPTLMEKCRAINRQIPHTVGGFFGLSMKHEVGCAFLKELYRLAHETRAFCGPWDGGVGVQHRHDQTAMSVIAWRLGMKLTDCPEFFAYGKAQDAQDPRTVVVADGDYA
jgi:hypothetical protein